MAAADVVVSFLLLVSIFGVLSLGLNLKFGHTGLLDFGHVGFYLIGAYTAALVVLPPDDPGDFTAYVVGLGDVPLVGTWPSAVLAGTLLAGVVGGLVALPTIRLREDYLAITVLGVSVIFQRVVQSESWLANGPDALRGYSPPLQSLFPLGTDGLAGPLVAGFVAAVVWGVSTAGLAQARRARPGDEASDGPDPVDRLVTAATLGLRRAGPLADGGLAGQIAAAALAVGVVVAAVLAATGELLYVGILLSLYSWGALGTLLVRRYGDRDPRAVATGVALGTGLLAALLPLPLVDGLPLKIALTLGLLGALVGAYAVGVARVGWLNDAKLAVVGVGALWFVGLWYFLLPIVGPLRAGEVTGVVATLFRNVVWVLRFGGDVGVDYAVTVVGDVTVQLDYARFQLALFGVSLAGLYVVAEATVRSPFGRVLRAVRNDEDVVKSIGKDPFVYKFRSMVLGSALGGFAGSMWAMYAQGLTFTTFAPRVTFIALLIVFVGGVGNNRGTILGAGIFWAFQQATTQLASFFPPAVRVNVQAFRLVVVGVLFLILLYYLPEGLLGRQTYGAPAAGGNDPGGGTPTPDRDRDDRDRAADPAAGATGTGTGTSPGTRTGPSPRPEVPDGGADARGGGDTDAGTSGTGVDDADAEADAGPDPGPGAGRDRQGVSDR